MNVIFLDFDGVLNTYHYHSNEDIENKVKILADICQEYNCKIVIESSYKDSIDEETMEIYNEWVNFLFSLFKKYHIECIGRCPNVIRRISPISYIPMWKEDEIRLYLFRHPEIEHYCVIDDDDMPYVIHGESDLNKVRNHLVRTKLYDKDDPASEGLLPNHKEEVGKILKKENEIKKLVLKQNKKAKK